MRDLRFQALLIVLAAAVIGACAGMEPAATARADLPHFYHAIDVQDLDLLAEAAEDVRLNEAERRLAAAVRDAAFGLDARASDRLDAVIASNAAPATRARAMLTLSGVRVRQGRYGEAAALMSQIEAMEDNGGVAISGQTRDFLQALSGLLPMEADLPARSELDLARDKFNLPRLAFSVAGENDEAVFDTGAAFSTVTASTAQRLGLRFLGADAAVTGSTGAIVQSGLAYAEELRVGDALFRNVAFIVVPDAALTFPEADYAISSIIGFPLIARMGRLTLRRTEAGERLIFGASEGAPSAASNLVYSGWQPVVSAEAGESADRLRFFLDTGSRASTLYALALAESSFGASEMGALTTHGAGGQSQEETQIVRDVRLRIGVTDIAMDELHVLADDGSARHGVLGQDVLTRYDTVTLDFGAMTITLQ